MNFFFAFKVLWDGAFVSCFTGPEWRVGFGREWSFSVALVQGRWWWALGVFDNHDSIWFMWPQQSFGNGKGIVGKGGTHSWSHCC